MHDKLSALAACLLTLVLASPARANVIYTFTTTSPAANAGPVSGSFVVPDNAISDGFISFSELISYNFSLPTPPSVLFSPATWTNSDSRDVYLILTQISVHSGSGELLSGGRLQFFDNTTHEILDFPSIAPSSAYGVAPTVIDIPDIGSGNWIVERTVAAAPEPGTLALVVTGLMEVGVLHWDTRRRKRPPKVL